MWGCKAESVSRLRMHPDVKAPKKTRSRNWRKISMEVSILFWTWESWKWQLERKNIWKKDGYFTELLCGVGAHGSFLKILLTTWSIYGIISKADQMVNNI